LKKENMMDDILRVCGKIALSVLLVAFGCIEAIAFCGYVAEAINQRNLTLFTDLLRTGLITLATLGGQFLLLQAIKGIWQPSHSDAPIIRMKKH